MSLKDFKMTSIPIPFGSPQETPTIGKVSFFMSFVLLLLLILSNLKDIN